MLDIKQRISEILAEIIPALDSGEIKQMLEYPPNDEMGDVALPCFKLSRILRKSPIQIAEELAGKIPADPKIAKVEAVSGYLNFFLDKEEFVRDVLSTALNKGNEYGSRDMGKGRNIVIDYSAPNIAKPFHVGHLRSTAIGNSLYRIFNFLGYNSIGINHLGDWGTQFGKLIVAYKNWGSKDSIENGSIKELMAIYVKFS